MLWSDFREEYRQTQLATLRDRSIDSAESRLDIAERILKPRTLGDVARADALHDLQSRLLAGEECRQPKPKKKKGAKEPQPAAPVIVPRSAHTVRTHMTAVITALNWAALQGWLPAVPKVRLLKVSKLRHAKGRGITLEEFERMLAATEKIVGPTVAESWKFLLRGLWSSALRLEEIMGLSWDIPGTIRPVWSGNRFGVLEIPAECQKNDTEESIPLLPWFEDVLNTVAADERSGYVFNPGSLEARLGRFTVHSRPNAEWAGKVISRIGKAAGVIVVPATAKKKAKYVSAHDLRRSCAERLLDAGVPPLTIARAMRHSSWETTKRHYAAGSVQKDAATLRAYLGTVSGAVVVS